MKRHGWRSVCAGFLGLICCVTSAVPCAAQLRAVRVMAAPVAVPASGNQISTLSQFEQAAQISKLAASNGLTDLSLRAISAALHGGPPLEAMEEPDQSNPFGRQQQSTNSQAAVTIHRHLASLEQIWRLKKVSDERIYEALREAVFPESRSQEVFLYPIPLAQNPSQPQSVSILLVKAAIQARKTDDLKSQAEQRLQQPLGELSSRILLAQLAMGMRDREGIEEQLKLIAARLKQDSLQNTAELACHVAIPAMSLPDLPVAVELVALALDHIQKGIQSRRGGGQQEPVTSLTFRLASHYFQAGKPEEGKKLVEAWIGLQGPMWSNYGGDYPAYQRKLAFLRAGGEYARAGLQSESLDMFGRFADAVTSRDYQTGGPGKDGAILLSGLAQLNAEKRYLLLKDWSFPTKSRLSVRLVTGLVTADRAPAAFDAVRGVTPQGPRTAQIMNSLELLIDAARQLGKLEELQAEMAPHAAAKVENAELALALIQLSQKKGASALPTLVSLNGTRAKEAADPQNVNRRARSEGAAHDAILARAALLDPDPQVRDQGLKLTNHFIGYTQRVYDQQMMPAMKRAMRTAQMGPEAARELDIRSSDAGLKHWVAGSTTSITIDQQVLSLPNWWAAHEDHIIHTCGMGGDFLYFAYPLQGNFEVEAEGIVGAWSEGNVSFAGLAYVGLHGGSNIRIFPAGRRTEVISMVDPVEDGHNFNKSRIEVRGDEVTYRINGHPIHVLKKTPGTSPFFALYTERQWESPYRRIRITGSPVIPRQVRLVDGSSLLGWACDFYGESQPRFLPLNAENSGEVSVEPNEFDWSARDGEIHGRIVAGASLGSSAPMQSRLYYNRPLRDRETVVYDFWYEPGDGGSMTHPALDRLAFLLEPDGVRVHWMTPSNDPSDEAALPSRNAIIEESCRRGPKSLPLKATDWNRVEVSLANDTATLKLNGTVIYERPLERDNSRQFGFYHDKSIHSVRVRNVELSGDWPKSIDSIGDLLEPSRPRTAEERRALAHLIDEKYHSMGLDDVLLRTRAVPDAERYASLKNWVLPSDDHSTFRVYGEFTPADPLPVARTPITAGDPITSPVDLAPDASAASQAIRRRLGGELIAPALDLVAVARRLGKLDELATQLQQFAASSELNERSRKSLLGLVALAKGDHAAANAQLKALTPDRAKGLSDDWSIYERWPEFLLVWKATDVQQLRLAARNLAEQILDSQNRKAPGGRWEPMARAIEHRLVQFQSGAESLPSPSVTSPGKQWAQVTFEDANSRSAGLRPVWRFDGNQASHIPGFGNDPLYFQSPLRGKFAVECQLTTFGWREQRLMYNSYWAGPTYTHERFDIGSLTGNSDGGAITPKLDPMGDWFNAKLEVEPGKAAWYANGRKYHEIVLPDAADPWLAIQSWGHFRGAARNVKITGNPEIPAEINISAQDGLSGWWPSMYQESFSGDNAAWARNGDEIIGRNPGNEKGRFRQSILQYHRPFLEDGQIRYEFFYVPGTTCVHPALGRAAFLLEPDGIQVHWLTDAQFERTGVPPDNASVEKDCQRGGKLPLKTADWNSMKLDVKGDVLTLTLNDVLVYERKIEPWNQRQFGLFRYGSETDVRVKNVVYRGDWPKVLPAPNEQELARNGAALAALKDGDVPARWSWNFQGERPQGWKLVDAGNAADYRTTTNGTQVVIVPDSKRTSTTGYQWPKLTIAGDFEVTLDYKDFQSRTKTENWEVPRIEIKLVVGYTHIPAMTHRRRHDDSLELSTLLGLHSEPGNYMWHSTQHPVKNSSGRMRLVRKAGTAYYLYADHGSNDWTLLEQRPVATTDVKDLFLGLRAEKPEDHCSAVFTSIDIRAAKFEIRP